MWCVYTGPSLASDELLSATTSRLLYVVDGGVAAEVGVMRPNGNFSAPYLWLLPAETGLVRLRGISAAVDALQNALFEPVILAECATRRDEHFLAFCGFTMLADLGDRYLTQRVRQ